MLKMKNTDFDEQIMINRLNFNEKAIKKSSIKKIQQIEDSTNEKLLQKRTMKKK